MRKQEQEALRRLEAALLEQEHTEEAFTDDTDFLDDTWADFSAGGYEVYNTDVTDVDMDTYSEEVHRGSRGNPLLAFFMVVSLLLLAAAIWILLQFLGVIG